MGKHLNKKFFEEHILPHYNYIYYYLLKILKDEHLAKDVIQNTMEKAWKKLRTLRNPGSAKAWLFEIASHELTTMQRVRYKLMGNEESVDNGTLDEIYWSPDDILTELIKAEDLEILNRAKKCLSDKKQTLLILRYQLGYSYVQIAQYMDMTPEAVRTAISRACHELKKNYLTIEKGGKVRETEKK